MDKHVFIVVSPNAHNQAPRGRVRAPPKVACIVMFDNHSFCLSESDSE